jgi:uncharacterized protein YukE
MSGLIRADLEQLALSAHQADVQGEELTVGHATAHGRMDAAQVGWVGLSAPSMAAKLAKWQATVAGLQARVIEHGRDLHHTAFTYSTTDESSAENIERLHAVIAQVEALRNL